MAPYYSVEYSDLQQFCDDMANGSTLPFLNNTQNEFDLQHHHLVEGPPTFMNTQITSFHEMGPPTLEPIHITPPPTFDDDVVSKIETDKTSEKCEAPLHVDATMSVIDDLAMTIVPYVDHTSRVREEPRGDNVEFHCTPPRKLELAIMAALKVVGIQKIPKLVIVNFAPEFPKTCRYSSAAIHKKIQEVLQLPGKHKNFHMRENLDTDIIERAQGWGICSTSRNDDKGMHDTFYRHRLITQEFRSLREVLTFIFFDVHLARPNKPIKKRKIKHDDASTSMHQLLFQQFEEKKEKTEKKAKRRACKVALANNLKFKSVIEAKRAARNLAFLMNSATSLFGDETQ